MKAKIQFLTILLAAFFSFTEGKAVLLPSNYFSEVTEGTFYLYNVNQNQFLVRLSNNFPGLSNSPAEVTVKRVGTTSKFTIMFADGKYLKTGYWNNQYLWTDGTAELAENQWEFVAINSGTNVYQLKRAASETLNGKTGSFYANGINADTIPSDDCQWALIETSAYADWAKQMAIPAKYRSAIPTTAGDYYLYDVLNQTFLNTANRTLSEAPVALTTFTPVGSQFLISGAADAYLKIGVYKGQYLWSNGDANNTKWTLEAAAGQEAEKTFYIYTNNFSETNSEVAGKTLYLTGTNASAGKPLAARWALISAADYVDYITSGEGYVDGGAVADNKAAMTTAMGDATSLLSNPTFERSSDGWWGGERALCQLYRGSGYAYEATTDGTQMLQTVKNMPKGTYKVVAAVRGDQGTTVVARVADNSGDAVVNDGSRSVKAQLNMNGVMMPYSAVGGFNAAENAQGWTWATATGELTKDGHLKVEFVTAGNGKVDVADVHLYYISDGSLQYAVAYSDGVDAEHHAVTCDLTAQNPNRLFTSTTAITTASGAKLNNNLMGGAVKDLMLWDGYDFVATEDFVATKATFYRSIPAGSVAVVCAPFAITGGAGGTFYEPMEVWQQDLKIKAVKKTEPGKAYLLQTESDVTAMTGSGNVKATPANSAADTRLNGIFSEVNVPEGSYVLSDDVLRRVTKATTLKAFNGYFTLSTTLAKVNLNFDASEEDAYWKHPQLVTSDFALNQECYLYNVIAGKFWTEGNAYGTQASMGETGLKCKFVQNGNSLKLTNYSVLKGAWRTAYIATNGAIFVDGENVTECNWTLVPGNGNTFKLLPAAPNATYNQDNYPEAMMGLDLFEDKNRNVLAALLFSSEEPGEGLYLTDWQVATAADYNVYQQAMETYKTALSLRDLLEEAKALGKDVAAEQAVYENTQSTLDELLAAIASVTNKILYDDISNASWTTPVDVTNKFITNPRYENGNEGWAGTEPSVNTNLQNAEMFNKTFNYYQILRGLPEGYYKVNLQGFYRAGLEGPAYEAKNSGNEEKYMIARLYATSEAKDSTITKVQSVFNNARTEKLGVDGELQLGNWWIPNNMSAVAAYFAAGYYQENSVMIHVTNGTMRIGIRKDTAVRRDWLMFDNWSLTYYGKEPKE